MFDRCYECGVRVDVATHERNGGYCAVHRPWAGNCPARIGSGAYALDCIYERGHAGNCAFLELDGPNVPADEPRETQGARGFGIVRY
jgi:hypothetical protein